LSNYFDHLLPLLLQILELCQLSSPDFFLTSVGRKWRGYGTGYPRFTWKAVVKTKERIVNLEESLCSTVAVDVAVTLVGAECIFIAVLAIACVI